MLCSPARGVSAVLWGYGSGKPTDTVSRALFGWAMMELTVHGVGAHAFYDVKRDALGTALSVDYMWHTRLLTDQCL